MTTYEESMSNTTEGMTDEQKTLFSQVRNVIEEYITPEVKEAWIGSFLGEDPSHVKGAVEYIFAGVKRLALECPDKVPQFVAEYPAKMDIGMRMLPDGVIN